jgi:hypothetical protein
MINKQSSFTTLISIAVAVLLFLMANYFEDDARWQVPQSEDGERAPASSRTTFESPLQTISAAENCEQTERELVRAVDSARACRTDDECTIFDFGYPIQCLTSVAKSEITRLRLQYRRYEASCDFRVYYDCPTGHLDRRPVCNENRCAVELESVDELRDDTLDYLGIE